MKQKGIPRRKFLQTSAGAALAGAIPLNSLVFASNQPVDSDASYSDESMSELHRIVQKYGSEFGQVKPEKKEG